jgi:hypothetical protein
MDFDYRLSKLDEIAKTMNERRRFIATRDRQLAAKIASLIDT